MEGITSWHSYPKIYALGHAVLGELFNGDVVLEEKIDGSQFSFARFGTELKVRSKGVVMNIDAPEKMFSLAVDWVKMNAENLREGWTYRAEYLRVPKHNTLAYDRVPKNHLIIFDINAAEEVYLPYEDKQSEAERLGLECVARLEGDVTNAETFKRLLDLDSCLGGQKIEGVIVKNYSKFGPDKKVLMGKYVSEAFKEVHQGDWRERNPSGTEIIQKLVFKYRTPARWAKAVQHMRDAGKLENSPRDIGLILREAQTDIEAECREEIKADLYEWARDKVMRGAIGGIAEWYKDELLKQQFRDSGA